MGNEFGGVSGVRLKLRGVNAVMKSAGVQSALNLSAMKIAHAANNKSGLMSYEARTPEPHRWIARARVGTTDVDSMVDNSMNNTLLKSLDAGRR